MGQRRIHHCEGTPWSQQPWLAQTAMATADISLVKEDSVSSSIFSGVISFSPVQFAKGHAKKGRGWQMESAKAQGFKRCQR
jgi:hypothetical protein